MRIMWLSWKPPDISPEAELQLAQTLAAHGRGQFVSSFLGFSESRFSEVHTPGLIYLGATIVFAFFAPVIAGLFGLGFVIYYLSFPVALARYVAWLRSVERKYSLPPTASPPNRNAAPDDNAFYEVVAGELDQKRIDKALWTRAEANSAGDDKLAKSLYIRYRAQALQDGQSQKARAEHEAQVLERERQKAQERQIKEAAARKAAEERSKGCGIAFLVCIGIFILIAVLASIGGGQSQPTAPTNSPPPPRPPPAPSLAERQAAINRTFADLDAEYRALATRRASLAPNDSAQLAAFNRDAADYTRRVQQARAEKARLEQ